jgi:ribose 5-phosphate isomerase B
MIYIGSDHAGFELKEHIKEFLRRLGHEVADVGAETLNPDDDYPDYVEKVVQGVQKNNLGIVICATGIGSCIAANKFRGIRAALAYDEENARLSKAHNNANVLCLGGRTMDRKQAENIVRAWLETQFSGEERHARRLKKLEGFEK